MEIYRPGMGKFSSQTLKPGESKNSRSNSPTEPEPETEKPEAAKKTDKPPRSGYSRGQQQVGQSYFLNSGVPNSSG